MAAEEGILIKIKVIFQTKILPGSVYPAEQHLRVDNSGFLLSLYFVG